MKKMYVILLVALFVMVGCNKGEDPVAEPGLVVIETPVETPSPEPEPEIQPIPIVLPSPEPEGPTEEELQAILYEHRMLNIETKIAALIDTYKDIWYSGDEADIHNLYNMERADGIFGTPSELRDSRKFNDGSIPRYDWPKRTSIIQQFIRRVNKGETENFNTIEWFLSFENELDFEAGQDRLDIFTYTDEEIEAEAWNDTEEYEYYMYTATSLAATIAQYEHFITFGKITETDEWTLRNGMISAYTVPILLNDVDYGIIAVFDENDLMLNIISTDDSDKEFWFYYSK